MKVRSTHLLLAALASALAAQGCASGLHPTLGTYGLQAAHFQFVIAYRDDRRHVGGARWDLDNFLGNLSATKSAPDYRTWISLDSDGDGRTDFRTDEDLYDARLVDRVSGTTMWMRSIPIPASMRERDLAVLADAYADAVTGGSYYAVDLGQSETARDRRFATHVTDTHPCTVDGVVAHSITFTVSDVDRAQIGDATPELQVTVVLAHALSSWQSEGHAFPSILVAGLAVTPEDADVAAPDFASLLSRVRVLGAGHSVREAGTTTCP